MGTDKRERQKTARLQKIEAEQAAAKRARTRRTAIRAVVGVAVLVGLLFAATAIWGDDDGDETETTDDSATTTSFPEMTTTTLAPYTNPALSEEVLARTAPDPAPPPAETAADALEISTLIEGQGDGAVAGDTVVAHYVGKMPDGTVFDESWSRGQPFPVANIGQGQVIDGWNEGLIGAKVGERRRLVIGSNKAYGATGNQGIPPNTPLVFEIDIVDIQKAGG